MLIMGLSEWGSQGGDEEIMGIRTRAGRNIRLAMIALLLVEEVACKFF